MNTMSHEGYLAEIEIDEETGLLTGVVLNTRATLHFSGRTVKDLRKAFARTIEDYKDWCRKDGVEPEKPYSGTLSLRLAPDLHRRVAAAAAREGKSVNAFIGERLEEAV